MIISLETAYFVYSPRPTLICSVLAGIGEETMLLELFFFLFETNVRHCSFTARCCNTNYLKHQLVVLH